MLIILRDVSKVDWNMKILEPIKSLQHTKPAQVIEVPDSIAHYLIKQGLAVGPCRMPRNPVTITKLPDVSKQDEEHRKKKAVEIQKQALRELKEEAVSGKTMTAEEHYAKLEADAKKADEAEKKKAAEMDETQEVVIEETVAETEVLADKKEKHRLATIAGMKRSKKKSKKTTISKVKKE